MAWVGPVETPTAMEACTAEPLDWSWVAKLLLSVSGTNIESDLDPLSTARRTLYSQIKKTPTD